VNGMRKGTDLRQAGDQVSPHLDSQSGEAKCICSSVLTVSVPEGVPVSESSRTQQA